MHSLQFVAVAALAGLAAAQTCTKDIEITTPTQVIDCEVVDASITVSEDVAGDLLIDGPEMIKGDLIIKNASNILSISSNTIGSIGGMFELSSLNGLSAIRMDSLRTINELSMVKLTQLRELQFGSEGVTKGTKVTVSDTFLDSLSGLKLASVDILEINNNRRLTKFDSDLVNVTTGIFIVDNGNNIDINLGKLTQAKEIQIRNAKSLLIPRLKTVTGSLKLDKNSEMESLFAPNLTKVTDAVSFINNTKLSNVSLPLLTEISGDLRIFNNKELTAIDGFPVLETVKGGINLGGNFESVEMPELRDVKGSVTVSSTTDISDFCDFFDKAKDDDRIQGKEECTSKNSNALEGGKGGEESDGKDKDEESAAGNISVSSAVLGLALIAGIAQLL